MSNEISKQDDLPEATGLSLTSPRKKKFLTLLASSGNVRTAAAQLGTSYSTIKKHASDDPYFAEMIEIAEAQYLADLEAEALRRAKDGVKKGIYFKGEKIDEETIYSDRLMELMLKAADKDKYSPKPTENKTLVLGDNEGVAAALGKFLGVDLDKKASEDSGEDIIDGEYKDIG